MYQSKLSNSKSKIIFKNLPSSQILHQGYQRKISQTEYMKTFPKIRLKLNAQNHHSNIKQQCSQQYFWAQVENMKGENKKLEEMNQDLIAKIRKETKLNQVYEKKMESQSIQSMPFQKIVQIKLLLEVEELEQILRNKQIEVECIVKSNKRKKQELEEPMLEPFVQLTAILMEDYQSVPHCLKSKQSKLINSAKILHELKQKRQKLRAMHNKKLLQFDTAKLSIQKQSTTSWNKHEITHQSNQNSMISRTKNIQDIQYQIAKIQAQFKQQQIKIQQELDKKVRQKLTLLKQIEQLQLGLGKKQVSQNGIGKGPQW